MNRRRFLQCCATGLLTLTGQPRAFAAKGSSLPTSALQAILDRSVSDAGLPGILLGIDTPRGVFLGAAGKADLSSGRAMAVTDQIRLASVTKNLTAALILRLCEDGLLSLDGILGHWLPGCVPNAETITVTELLNHTAGVYDHENDFGLDTLSPANFTKDWTNDEILAFPRAHGPDFSPGAAWSYSNTGYYLLGMLAEQVTGISLETAIRQYLLTPLGLARTNLARPGTLAAPYSGGYCLTPDERFLDMTDWNMSWDWAAGGAASTVNDMLAWGKALFGGQVLRPETLRAMTTPVGAATFITADVGYGFGVEAWSRDEFFGQPCFSHGGANGGTRTFFLHYPRASRTIFAAVNRFDYAVSGIDASALLRAVLAEVAPLVNFPPVSTPATVGLLLSS